jgi:hypothetical protein
LIAKLCAENRELQARINISTVEVKEYKRTLTKHGLTIKEEEVNME